MDFILFSVILKTAFLYLDDIVGFSRNNKDHMVLLAELLTLRDNAGLTVRLKKCAVVAENIDYLRRVMRPGHLEISDATTKTIV